MSGGSLPPAFLAPRSVAVVGASRDPSKVGGSVLANLRAASFPGRVVPINPRAGSIQGLRALPSVLALEEPVDLAVIAVPAADVLPALEACVARGVAGAIIISAGFREAGPEGQAREAKLRSWLRGQPIRVMGPNCLGWIRPSSRLNATFAPGMPIRGGIGFVSHSGALATAILDWARDRSLGFSFFASLGNQADLTEADVLEAAAEDAETHVIAAYIEGVADGPRFIEALTLAATAKPVVLIKAGRSAEGARAVASHTGALAGSDVGFHAAVRQAGAVRVTTVEELFDLADALATQPLPKGRRVLVVTNGGGLGIVAADAARAVGLAVTPVSDAARARLCEVLPPNASVANPVDLVGDADANRYRRALEAIHPNEDCDAALVILTVQAATDASAAARAIVGSTRGWDMPLVTAFVGGPRVRPGTRALEESHVPCYAFPERAVSALAGMARVAERRRATPQRVLPPRPDLPAGLTRSLERRAGGALSMSDLESLLEVYGIPVVRSCQVAGPAEAAAAAAELGLPVALKVVSAEVSHKSDVGGVRLGLGAPGEVAAAAEKMLADVRRARPEATIQGLLVQTMGSPGRELLVGMTRDPQFGPLVVVGFGGRYVEVLRDTAARLAPVSEEEAVEMLGELRMAPVLRAFRGEAEVDLPALARAVARFSRLLTDLPMLSEIELNPLVARPDGVLAVDARATLAAPPSSDVRE